MTAGGIPWITSLTSGWHSTLHPRDWMSSWSNAPQRNGSLKRPKLERCEHPWFRVPNSLLTLQTLDTLRKCSIFPAETTTKTPQELAENRPSASMASVWENGRLGLPFDGGTLSIDRMVGKGLLRVCSLFFMRHPPLPRVPVTLLWPGTGRVIFNLSTGRSAIPSKRDI
jgi:hypothetical protein